MNAFWIVAIIAVVIGVLWLAIADEQAFNQSMDQTRTACLADGESKWTCEAVVDARRAKRSADQAASAAAASMAVGIANSGR